jgi:hypothetical protein
VSTGGVNAGAAIDADNNAWTIAYSPANNAYKIDPATYKVVTVPGFSNPYTYSDMTGYQLRNASRAGTFRTTLTGCEMGVTTWSKLTYALTAPTGTQATIRYRAADSIANLSSAPWSSVTGASPVPLTLPAMPNPTYLQVEVNMSSLDPNLTPVLSSLSASYSCRLIIG